MATSLRALSLVTIALAQAAVAQSVESQTPSQIYLKCLIKNDPEGLNDVHIDFAKKQFTDYFGTVRPFREEGPFLISETFTEVDGTRKAVTTVRINRFTLSYQYMWPAQQILKNGQCPLIDKKLKRLGVPQEPIARDFGLRNKHGMLSAARVFLERH